MNVLKQLLKNVEHVLEEVRQTYKCDDLMCEECIFYISINENMVHNNRCLHILKKNEGYKYSHLTKKEVYMPLIIERMKELMENEDE